MITMVALMPIFVTFLVTFRTLELMVEVMITLRTFMPIFLTFMMAFRAFMMKLTIDFNATHFFTSL
ncbi:MAG: hypothetical protein H6Q69_1041 [Firmicutes bacterium]|nr:hypothetical protein [Bacillota bacterium]